MTVHMKDSGKFLVTRRAAKKLLAGLDIHETPVLDFSGVDVANHPFMDELAKGIVAKFPSVNLHSVKVANSNPYIDNCIAAGFTTASNKL